MIVADLICPPAGSIEDNAVVRKRSDQDSALKGGQLLNIYLMEGEFAIFIVSVVLVGLADYGEGLLIRIEVPYDVVTDS